MKLFFSFRKAIVFGFAATLATSIFAESSAAGNAAGSKPMRMGYEYSVGGRVPERQQQFANFAASGLNTVLLNTRLLSPAVANMKYNSETGEVTIVNWPGNANRNKISLKCPNDFISFANDAAAHGIDVMFTHCLWWGDWEVLKILPSYSKTYIAGPARFGDPGVNNAPAPLDKGFWLGIQLCAAKFYATLSLKCPNIKGFMMDFETYPFTSIGSTYTPQKHSSFDDQTWTAVIAEMVKGRILQSVPLVSISERYSWLESNGLLQKYFDIQNELIYEQIAVPFRKAIDAINPNFMLGFYPYEVNGYCKAWARGMATAKAPVIIMSEAEYYGFNAPQSLSRVSDLNDLHINYRYLPGFMIHSKKHTPEDLKLDIKRCRHFIGDGYWLYDTTAMWNDLKELDGAPKDFWQAIANGNNSSISLSAVERYLPMNRAPASPSVLVTGNRFFDGPKETLPVRVYYSPQNPNLTFYADSQKTKLFDGGELEEQWAAAWNPVLGQPITTVVDLSRVMELSKIYLRGGGHLPLYYNAGGTLTISTSVDGQAYAQLDQMPVKGGEKLHTPFVYENLNIKGRYIKINFLPDNIPAYPVFSLSELAVWADAK